MARAYRAGEFRSNDTPVARYTSRRGAKDAAPRRNNVAMHNDNVFAGVARRARAPRAIRRVNRRATNRVSL
jgi:hypothetical protein